MTHLRTYLLAGVATVVLAGAAHATVLTQTATVGVGGGNTVTTDLNNVAFSNAFNQFNGASVAALPTDTVTLNTVTVTFAAGAQTFGTITNTAAQAQFFTFTLSLNEFLASGTSTGGGAGATNAVINTFTLGGTNNVQNTFGQAAYNLASGASANYPQGAVGPVAVTNSSTANYTGTSVNPFVGTGTFGFDMDTLSAQTIGGGGGNVVSALNTTAGGTLTIAYNYTDTAAPTNPVPEPASMALLGAGLIGTSLIRRRSRK